MELEIIKHRDILFKDLVRVISIKSIAWPYPFESQVKWIKDNLKDEDEHVFLKKNDKDEAYMNLVKISFIINDKEYLAYGIGNVCSAEQGKGYGGELMMQVGSYLREKQRVGLLFCKLPLVQFYSHYGWEEVNRNVCDIKDSLLDDIYIMTYLVPERIISFIYHEKLF